ncbi:MAG TPA: efflux RND transporter periplasmic adaptor subunit [Fimbriimonadaceae bacterium]|jgi:RND family efflux transporter MFP subunit
MEQEHFSQEPRRKRKSYLPLFIGIIVLALIFILGLVPKLNNNKKINAEAKEAASEAPEVQFVKPTLSSEASLLLPATTQTLDETAVQARTEGYVEKVNVDIGAHVHAGEVLATIQSPDVDQQYNQASAQTSQSQATVGQSQADLQRSRASLDQSQSELSRQQATIKQAKAAYQSAVSKIQNTKANEETAKARLLQSDHALDVQKANLAQAEAQQELARVTAQRYQTLLKQGFVAQQDYDQAATTYKTSHSNVAAQQASLASAQADIDANKKAVDAAAETVKSAQSDADAAQSNVSANQEAYQSLVSAKKAAGAGVQVSQAAVNANQQAVRANAANQQRYSVLRGFEQITAPFDGVITARNVNVGSLVTPGAISTSGNQSSTPNVGLFGIARSDELAIYVSLPQSYYQAAIVGAPINIYIREFPGKTFVGKLERAAGALDQATRTLLTEISLSNQDGKLVPGMYAQVMIPPVDSQKTLRVPADAYTADSAGTRVLLIDQNNKVHWTKVQVGRDFGTDIEILSGITADDRVVDNPSDLLVDDEVVKPVAAKSGVPGAAGSAPPGQTTQSKPPAAKMPGVRQGAQ